MKIIMYLVFLLTCIPPSISLATENSLGIYNTQESEQKIQDIQWQLRELETRTNERDEAAKKAIEDAQQEAEVNAHELAKQTEQAAENLRYEVARSSVKTKNSIFFAATLLAIVVFFTYLVSRKNKSSSMDDNQKYGIITILISFLLMLLVLMISEGWDPRLDYSENIMYSLKIQLIEVTDENSNTMFGPTSHYLIDIESKYILLALLTVAGYGLTTYIGATSAFKPWKKN